MQRPEEEVITTLKQNGVDFTASLPCEKIKTLLEMVGREFRHLPLTREEEGVGICAGAALAGTDLTDEVIAASADAAYRPAKPMDNTDFDLSWRKQMTRVYVTRALEELRERRVG